MSCPRCGSDLVTGLASGRYRRDGLAGWGGRPQVRILGQPGAAVVEKRAEQVGAGRGSDPSLAAAEVGADP